MRSSPQNSKSQNESDAFPPWGAFFLVEIKLKVTELVVNCVTSCHLLSKLRGARQRRKFIRLERPTWRAFGGEGLCTSAVYIR